MANELNPKSTADAVKMNREGADSLKGVAQERDRASRIDPNQDASALNAKKAREERWSTTSDWQGWPLQHD